MAVLTNQKRESDEAAAGEETQKAPRKVDQGTKTGL